MTADSTAAGTTAPEAGTGTAPGTQGTDQAPQSGTGTAQGSPAPTNESQAAPPDPALTKAQSELAKATARIQELEQAKLTDQERKDARLAELEAKEAAWQLERQSLILQHAAYQAASAAGAVYPQLVVNAVSPASVEWDKDGQPTNLDKVVAEVRQAYPAMFRVTPGQVDGGAGNGQPTAQGMNDLIRRGAGRA